MSTSGTSLVSQSDLEKEKAHAWHGIILSAGGLWFFLSAMATIGVYCVQSLVAGSTILFAASALFAVLILMSVVSLMFMIMGIVELDRLRAAAKQ